MPPTVEKNHMAIRKAFCAMQTAGEMMADRHYSVANDIPATLEAFKARYVIEYAATGDGDGAGSDQMFHDGVQREAMTLHCQRGQGEQNLRALVHFVGRGAMTTEYMKNCVKAAQEASCQRLIFVSAAKPNAIVKKQVDTINRTDAGVRVQVFEEEDLAVNITQHALVPQHRPLDPVEAKQVLDAHALQLHQLPRLLATDPVARYFGLDRGDMVEVKRRSESAGEYVTYRQVV